MNDKFQRPANVTHTGSEYVGNGALIETPARPQSAEQWELYAPEGEFHGNHNHPHSYSICVDKLDADGHEHKCIALVFGETDEEAVTRAQQIENAVSELPRQRADLLTAQATVAQWCIKHLEDEEAMGKLRAELALAKSSILELQNRLQTRVDVADAACERMRVANEELNSQLEKAEAERDGLRDALREAMDFINSTFQCDPSSDCIECREIVEPIRKRTEAALAALPDPPKGDKP